MRILALRGGNLASLADNFELNFETAPLRDAGLFAITGETGAGKSTILDALCLALYDKFPRVVVSGASEDAPDPSGMTLNASDPRAILRRGAGRGFAEADFIARDGVRYRARCELQRARGNVAGRLQNRGRSLYQLDEQGAIVSTVESGVEPVNRRIVELTDLTFDQFRRTALLAQGEFDAFLRAEAKERGELLEKITGAEIYGRLSKRAYEEDRQAQQVVAALEERRRQIGLMSEEERRATFEARKAFAEERITLEEERKAVTEALRRLDALSLAQVKLAQAEAMRDGAARAQGEALPNREKLQALARVAPLRAPLNDLLRAKADLGVAQGNLAETKARAEAAAATFTTATSEERAKADALAGHEAERARLTPLWAAAAALDARIASLIEDEQAAFRVAQESAKSAAQLRETFAGKRRLRDEAANGLALATKAFEQLAPAQPLSDRWQEIDEWLEKRTTISMERREAGVALHATMEELARGDASRAALDEADRADRDVQDLVTGQIAERLGALEALDEEALQREDEALTQKHAILSQLAGRAQAYDAAATEAARAGDDGQTHGKQAAALALRLGELETLRAAQAAADTEAARMSDLAEATASRPALHLRAALVEGVECPVCGSRDHPFTQDERAASALVDALRGHRAETRRQLAATEAALVDARGRMARIQALIEDAHRRSEEAQAVMSRAEGEYAAIRKGHDAAPESIVKSASTLGPLLMNLEAARKALAQKILAARRLRGDLEQLRKQETLKRAALDARRRERDSLTARMQAAAERRAALEAELKEKAERLASLDRSLAQFLQIADIAHSDLDRDPAGARARLEALGAQCRAARAHMSALDQSLRLLEPEVATLAGQVDGSAQAEAASSASLAERRRALEDARAQRAPMLDGAATEAHRARFEEVCETAARARESARLRLNEASNAKAAAEASAAHWTAACEAALQKAASTEAAWQAALAQAGFDEAGAAPLLAVTEAEQIALRQQVEALGAALAAAETAVMQRQADLAEAQAAAPQDLTREEIAARDIALSEKLEYASGQFGALGEQIAQDDRARESAAALAEEIEKARATGKVWAEINEAIGSATGDKFRRFAQGVTLGELVALANQRLALFSSRYALERSGEAGSLGLQIVDRDLGDERRSTRSLSGGERFLVSLALALALAGLEGRDSFVDTLFIDEGFGALDGATLDVAIDALETLQAQGRRVGVISHVESLQQRIATKVCIERRGGGLSVVRLRAPGFVAA